MTDDLQPEGIDLHTVSTHALAYLGDCVLELLVRTNLVERGLSSSARLNQASLLFVKATRQSEAMNRILPLLSPDELAVYKRGRNITHINKPQNASQTEYRNATGMEALFGWLYLRKQQSRMEELFRAAYADVLNDKE